MHVMRGDWAGLDQFGEVGRYHTFYQRNVKQENDKIGGTNDPAGPSGWLSLPN